MLPPILICAWYNCYIMSQTSIAQLLPQELLNEWHPERNGALDPKSLNPGSNKKVWWLGNCGHEWEAIVRNRTQRGNNCPFCSGSRILPGLNDLGTTHPQIAQEWHPNKNLPLTSSEVSRGSNKKVWWLGNCGHEWISSPNTRTSKNSGCVYCSGKAVLSGFNDLATTHPEISQEWHPEKNLPLTPFETSKGSNLKVWWLGSCGHEWEAMVNNRVSLKRGCPICKGQLIVPGVNDLAFLNPELAVQWHPTKNNQMLPFQVSVSSNKKAWWLGNCGHEWEAVIANRSAGTGCPVCSGNFVLKGSNDFASQYPHLALEWHPDKNDCLPEEVTPGSNKKVWWLGSCGHEWESRVSHRTTGIGCSICSGRITLKGFNDLATSHPKLAAEWHKTLNTDLRPEMFTRGSEERVWWVCPKGHEWESMISTRTDKREPGCRHCSSSTSKSENELVGFLRNAGFNIVPGDRKTIPGIELDIYIPDCRFAIEYNGLYWHTEAYGKDSKYHHNKWFKTKQAGIQLVQVWEDEWENSPELIKKMLLHKLGVNNDRKVYGRKTSVSAVSTNEAKEFLEENHIQGFGSGSHYLGLKDTEMTLVALMTLRSEPNGYLNIIRYATSANVIGGFTKLLNHAEKTLTPQGFVTFSDHCVSDGGLYANNGFILDKEIKPDYRYLVKGKRQHKFGYRLKRFREDPGLLWVDGKTERELALLNGIERIWDAGKTRWVKKL